MVCEYKKLCSKADYWFWHYFLCLPAAIFLGFREESFLIFPGEIKDQTRDFLHGKYMVCRLR